MAKPYDPSENPTEYNGGPGYGALELAGQLAKGLGVNALSVVKGISELPGGMAAAERAAHEYSAKYGPHLSDMSNKGQDAVGKYLVPAYDLINKYIPDGLGLPGSRELGQLAPLLEKYDPDLAATARVVQGAAPFVLKPGAGAANATAEDLAKGARTLYGDLTPAALERQQTAALRDRETPSYTKSVIPSSELQPGIHPDSFTPPDGAETHVAADPKTGEHIAAVTSIRRGDGVQNIRMDTLAPWRGYGIAQDLLQDAVSKAHAQGLPYYSDTQVSVPAARAFLKTPGVEVNDAVDHVNDPLDGDAARSKNGQPIFSFPVAAPSDEAQVGEEPHFDPNSFVGSQAFAEGGEVGGILDPVAKLVEQYKNVVPLNAKTPDQRSLEAFRQQFAQSVKDRMAKHQQLIQDAKDNGTLTWQPGDKLLSPKGNVWTIKGYGITGPMRSPEAAYSAETGIPEQEGWQAGTLRPHLMVGWKKFEGPQVVPYDPTREIVEPPPADPTAFTNSPADPANDPGFAEGGAVLSIFEQLAKEAKEGRGFMRDLKNNVEASSGYAVAPSKTTEMAHDTPPTPEQIKAYADRHGALLAQPGNHLGGWLRDDGKYVLDVSEVEPDFAKAVAKAKAGDQDGIFDLARKDNGFIPTTPDQLNFIHYGNPTQDTVTLDPNKMGTGIPGAERRRGGPKVTALYAADNSAPEPGLESKTQYRVTIPADRLYDMSADPNHYLDTEPSYSDAEAVVRDAGFLGYHTPGAQGIFRGQARLFQPVEATRTGPVAAAADAGEPSEATPDGLAQKYQGAFHGDVRPLSNDPRYMNQQFSGPMSSAITQARSAPDYGLAPQYVPEGMTRDRAALLQHLNLLDVGTPRGADVLDPTLNAQFAKGGLVRKYAEGGEVSALLDPIESLISQYKLAPPTEHAGMLAKEAAENGAVTYNPTSGDVHTSGYAVPEYNRSVPLSGAASPHDIHDFILNNQDAFKANPKSVLHIESDDDGNHSIHLAHFEPDIEGAQAAADAFGSPGIRDIGTRENIPSGPSLADPPPAELPADPNLIADLDPDRNQRKPVMWRHGEQTVANPQRNLFPGIYGDPKQIAALANSPGILAPENPLMKQLFGMDRNEMYDAYTSRSGNMLNQLAGAAKNPTGSAAAMNVITPQNTQRIIDILDAVRGTPMERGMVPWYMSDPLYHRFVQIYGEDQAPAEYDRFNHFFGTHSPGSPVTQEIERGSAANMMDRLGRYPDWINFGGFQGPDKPAELAGVSGHPYHKIMAEGLDKYLQNGRLITQEPKVPTYVNAFGSPDSFQTTSATPDAHFVRGIGLADTRTNQSPGISASMAEHQTIDPWFRNTAAQAGYEAVPGQSTLWGALSPHTGVESPVGKSKVELITDSIEKMAGRLGVSPETARDLLITGQAGVN